MICRTLSLIANSTWLSDASAAVFTADTCESCLGRHPFLRKIITTGERFSLSQNSCVFTQCSGDDNAPEHERSKEICHDYYIVDHVKIWLSTLNHCLFHSLLSIYKESFPRHIGKISIKTLRLDANEAFSLRSDFPNPSRLWHTFGTTHKNLGHQTSHLEQLKTEFSWSGTPSKF